MVRAGCDDGIGTTVRAGCVDGGVLLTVDGRFVGCNDESTTMVGPFCTSSSAASAISASLAATSLTDDDGNVFRTAGINGLSGALDTAVVPFSVSICATNPAESRVAVVLPLIHGILLSSSSNGLVRGNVRVQSDADSNIPNKIARNVNPKQLHEYNGDFRVRNFVPSGSGAEGASVSKNDCLWFG